jgi:hypothetical protein
MHRYVIQRIGVIMMMGATSLAILRPQTVAVTSSGRPQVFISNVSNTNTSDVLRPLGVW